MIEHVKVTKECPIINFMDTGIDTFHVKQVKQEEGEAKPTPIVKEVLLISPEDPLWTMYFDGGYSKEGSGSRVVLISSQGKTFKYSFLLQFSMYQ